MMSLFSSNSNHHSSAFIRSASKLCILWLICTTISSIDLLGATPHTNQANEANQDQTSPSGSLKLVVVIVVDQMRADYLTRYADLYTGGFHRMLEGGASFTNAAYPYAATVTGPGHASILSGMLPSSTGIIANSWYTPSLKRALGDAEDSTVSQADGNPKKGHSSPKNFNGANFVDEFRRSYENSKVIGLSLRDHAIILASGKNPDGAFWFDTTSGKFGTSTYYHNGVPLWVNSFNNKHLPDSYLGKAWKKLLPEKAYSRSGKDSAKGEGLLTGEKSPVFPHKVFDNRLAKGSTVDRYSSILPTPYANDLTISFAESAIDSEMLGRNDWPDMLIISFSSTDYAGHTFGPESHEMEDMMLQLDRQLDGFMNFLDTHIGLQNTLIALTADHGACPIPEQHTAEGARRVSSKNILDDLRSAVSTRFGYDESKENIIAAYSADYLYIDTAKLSSHKISVSAFEDALCEQLQLRPEVARCFTRDQLIASIAGGGAQHDSIQSRVEKSFNVQRSGSIAIVYKPYCFVSGDVTGTTHGSPYWYDRQVPLLFTGYGIKPGKYTSDASPLDLVPTIAKIIGSVSVPTGCAGKALLEAIQ